MKDLSLERSAQQKSETVVIETCAEWMGLSFVCLYSLINSLHTRNYDNYDPKKDWRTKLELRLESFIKK